MNINYTLSSHGDDVSEHDVELLSSHDSSERASTDENNQDSIHNSSEEFLMSSNDENNSDEEEYERRFNLRREYRRRLMDNPLSDIRNDQDLMRVDSGLINVEADESEVIDALHGRMNNATANLNFFSTDYNDANNDNVMYEGSNSPLHPARDHNYLPTPQPLFPEEWVLTGCHRLRQEERECDMIGKSSSIVMNDEKSVPNQKRGLSEVEGEIDHYNILPPLDSFQYFSAANKSYQHVTEHSTTTIPILEIDNVVLFPGSTLPLRLHDPRWIEYLGNLIDDARGIYGSRAKDSMRYNPSEVKIGIVPRIRRRTPRNIEGRSGARTGRWRVHQIRRGVTPIIRPRTNRTEVELEVNLNNLDSNTQEESQEQLGVEQSTVENQVDNDNDGIFHARQSCARLVQHKDPLIGRTGTVATIIFTHEDIANPVDVTPENLTSQRQTSVVWRRHTSELVVTSIGISRFRIIRSARDSFKSTHGQYCQMIPLYEVEEMNSGEVLVPQYLIQSPGLSNSPTFVREPIDDRSYLKSDEQKSVTTGDESDDETTSSANKYYNRSILNLSHRSAIPRVAYRALWPCRLSSQICEALRDSESFQGIYLALPTAAGVRTLNDNGTSYIQIAEYAAFANWLGSNLPLDENIRLNLLEMTNVVQQLKCILNKIQGMVRPMIRCKYCGSIITTMSNVFTLAGAEGTTGAYVNEYGVVHQTITVRDIDIKGIVAIGHAETKDSWFPGYSWTISHCSTCHSHLGWKFCHVRKLSDQNLNEDPNRPLVFWGLSSVTTEDNVPPRRLNHDLRFVEL